MINWFHYVEVHKKDTKHLANKRVCPKITERHLPLDTLSKMSVKLVTQGVIFIFLIN